MCSQKSQESVQTPQLNSLELCTQPNHQQAFGIRKSRIFSFSKPTNEKKARDSSQFKRWKSVRHSNQQRQHHERKKGWYVSIFVSCMNHSPTRTIRRLKKWERRFALYWFHTGARQREVTFHKVVLNRLYTWYVLKIPSSTPIKSIKRKGRWIGRKWNGIKWWEAGRGWTGRRW